MFTISCCLCGVLRKVTFSADAFRPTNSQELVGPTNQLKHWLVARSPHSSVISCHQRLQPTRGPRSSGDTPLHAAVSSAGNGSENWTFLISPLFKDVQSACVKSALSTPTHRPCRSHGHHGIRPACHRSSNVLDPPNWLV